MPAPLPVKPVSPGPAEEPIPGRCWECYLPIRKSGKNEVRTGTKFCTDNMGECRRRYNDREADRAERSKIFAEWSDSRHGERMFSIHCAAADAMYSSAIRCGINVTFTADDDGVLAVHTQPLPPFGPKCCVSVEAGDGYKYHDVEIVATAVDAGTLYTFEMKARPEGNAQVFQLSFEGDPGLEWAGEASADAGSTSTSWRRNVCRSKRSHRRVYCGLQSVGLGWGSVGLKRENRRLVQQYQRFSPKSHRISVRV